MFSVCIMDDKSILVAIIVVVIAIASYWIFIRKTPEAIISGDPSVSMMIRYLNNRLDVIRQATDYSEGFMQALGNVAHISDVNDKIAIVDKQYEEFKAEERNIMRLLSQLQR